MHRHYTVWFTNVTGRKVGTSDISWCVTVSARSEAEALEMGMADAIILNREFGMPPHGIRMMEEELRRLARVQLHEGL